MNKQTHRPLGIILEGPRAPYRSARRSWLRWVFFLAVLVALVVFAGYKMRKWKSIFHHQAQQTVPAEVSSAPEPAPVVAQPVSVESQPAPVMPSATPSATPSETPQPVVLAPLPAEVTLLETVSLTVKREGRVAGVVHLQPGQRVTPISISGGMMSVARGSAAGTIPIGSTDYGRQNGETNERREKAR